MSNNTVTAFLADDMSSTYNVEDEAFDLYDANTKQRIVFDVNQADELYRFIGDVLTDIGYWE